MTNLVVRDRPYQSAPLILGPGYRVLTLLVCDLVGSTRLSHSLDPEILHDLLQDYLGVCTRAVTEAGGFVARYTGDGLLAYFGYPATGERDAERALRAALDIQAALTLLSTSYKRRLATRVGVATGKTMVGLPLSAGATVEQFIVGPLPSLAARLQAAADPGQILVCAATREAVAKLPFQFVERAAVQFAGFDGPVDAWELAPDGEARASGFTAPGAADLVGRSTELGRLLELWRRVAEGPSQAVEIRGEAGIGKSRLVDGFRSEIAQEAHVALVARANPLFSNTPLFVFEGIGVEARPSRNVGEVSSADAPGDDLRSTLRDLATTSGAGREALFATWTETLRTLSRRARILLVVEDLQWIDPSSLELVERLIADETLRLLVVLTRRGATERLGAGSARVVLELGPLSDEQTRALIERKVRSALPASILRGLVRRAEGVPLFAEELAMAAKGLADRTGDDDLPLSLISLLRSRVDQTGPHQRVAQAASALGIEFNGEVLGEVLGDTPESLTVALTALVKAGVLQAAAAPSAQTFAFRHALLRDAAYQSLPRKQRQQLHRRAASVLVDRFPGLAGARPELVAQHWSLAGEPAPALQAWSDAGRLALSRSAFSEAETAVEQALECWRALPTSSPAKAREFELTSMLAGVRQIARGYSASGTVTAAADALALAQKNDDPAGRTAHLASAWMAASSAGRYGYAVPIAEELLELATQQGDAEQLAVALMARMTTRYRMGDLPGAEADFLAGKRFFRKSAFKRRVGAVPQTFGNAAVLAWLMGRPALARRRVAAVRALAEDARGPPYVIAFAGYMAAMQAVLMGDPLDGDRLAGAALDLSRRFDFPQFVATSLLVQGSARSDLGESEEGVRLMREGLTALDRSQSRAGHTMYLTWLAEGERKRGALDEALIAADIALSVNRLERFFRPESMRVRAAIRADRGEREAALGDVREAAALARDIGAVTLERRAARDLAAMKRA